jgi:hypothetical protein
MIRRTVLGPKPARGYSARPAGRPAGPRPGVAQPARSSRGGGPCAARAPAWSPRVGRRGGALAGGPAAASRWQVSWLGHHRHTADVPGKKSRGRAHQGGRAAVGWREAAGAARCSTLAPPLRAGCARQGERRSSGGGVAESVRRSGVPMEGSSGGVAVSSGAVLRLEAEVREGTASAASERDEKHGAGENFPAGGMRQHPFKGGAMGRSGGGARESGDAWGRAGEREGVPGAGGGTRDADVSG